MLLILFRSSDAAPAPPTPVTGGFTLDDLGFPGVEESPYFTIDDFQWVVPSTVIRPAFGWSVPARGLVWSEPADGIVWAMPVRDLVLAASGGG